MSEELAKAIGSLPNAESDERLKNLTRFHRLKRRLDHIAATILSASFREDPTFRERKPAQPPLQPSDDLDELLACGASALPDEYQGDGDEALGNLCSALANMVSPLQSRDVGAAAAKQRAEQSKHRAPLPLTRL